MATSALPVTRSSSAATSATAERLDVLDGLRGLAILLVVWYHAWLVSGQAIPALNFVAEAGFLGVDLFFFISGFCLFYPYARAQIERTAEPTTRRFFARRAAKIVPSYLLALGLFAVVYHARFASPQDALVQIGSHLTFLHTLHPQTYGSISGPLWTIGVEVQFYLVFPLIAPWLRRAPLITYGALVAVAESYRLVLAALGKSATFWCANQLPAYLDIFGAGMIASLALVAFRTRVSAVRREQLTRVSIAAFAIVLLGIARVSAIGRAADMNAVYDWVNAHRIFIGPLCIVLALSSSFAVDRWRSIVATRALVFLSLISYNLYLWNLEIVVWFREAHMPAPLAFGLAIVTAIGVATAITFAVERPILEADLRAWWSATMRRLPSLLSGSGPRSNAGNAA